MLIIISVCFYLQAENEESVSYGGVQLTATPHRLWTA